MAEFKMPSLGADMESGTLLEWRVAVGDHVTRGDIIAEIDTDKSTVEIEVFESGTVSALLVEPGTTVPVGTPLALIDTTAASPAAASLARPAASGSPAPAEPEWASHRVMSPLVRRRARELGVDTDRVTGTGTGGRITREDVERAAGSHRRTPVTSPGGASPLARRRAAELGVEITGVTGSGPGGAVRLRDVLAASSGGGATTPQAPPAPTPASPAVERAPTEAMDAAARKASIRAAIARLMTTANREIPHYHVASNLDFGPADAWLTSHNADLPAAERILPAALLFRATALAAAKHSELNGYWVDDAFQPADGVNLAVAVSLRGGGLIAPVLRAADQLSLSETMQRLADLVRRARQGSLRGSELSGASLTVTNLGTRGAEAVFGVIHPPQVALVGFGRVVERPWAVDGMVGIRPVLTATLSGDHRATDGHAGSLFLETIDAALQHPERL